ncbi:hypothetical protein ACFFGH_06680 [Lysobacter korlensis]|uniref:Uncharacterized protein n=1 Tax=Lysobacter korlensis TaxID=553636 RepID=A0ABV6RKM8_9GAMM
MRQCPRPLQQKLEPDTYAHDKLVYVRVSLPRGDAPIEHVTHVPLPLMFRLYHLGRAYDLPRIAAMHPRGSFYVDFISLQTLLLELQLLTSVISDPALLPHIEALAGMIELTAGDSGATMFVKVPS